ncbi:MAG: YigZ family protein [Deltaproteobacteria bacterium]|nr:YigZ family protein [Deltaproteobacteria bacterium]MBN2671579.1 YigZ family protein [Deltaproteobacteria bacterium]
MHTLFAPATALTEIKKSKFITHAAPVQTKEEALAFLDSVRDPDATHNCWAYKLGTVYRFSDDGEPGGTAGKPILSAIEGSGVDNVMVVVIRFFGGIKLGAGGLVRAYANAAATCLGHAEKIEVVEQRTIHFSVPFDSIGTVYPLIEKFNAQKEDESFLADRARYTITLEAARTTDFKTQLRDATSGSAHFEEET